MTWHDNRSAAVCRSANHCSRCNRCEDQAFCEIRISGRRWVLGGRWRPAIELSAHLGLWYVELREFNSVYATVSSVRAQYWHFRVLALSKTVLVLAIESKLLNELIVNQERFSISDGRRG